jgi:hypothetical protein
MFSRFAKCLAPIALQCAACGTDSNPFTIEGQVHLREFPDGGTEVLVLAVAQHQLETGELVESLDAGIALNGILLGPSDLPGTMQWARPSLPGAGYGLEQTLSVVGSDAAAKFTCPGAASFTAPSEGASLTRGQPVHVAWAMRDGGPAVAASFGFSIDNPPPGTLGVIGVQLLPPGSSSTEFTFPAEFAGSDARVSLSVIVPGPAPSASYCATVPIRSVLFP